MNKAVMAVVLALSGVSFAQGTQQQTTKSQTQATKSQTAHTGHAGQMDMSKMGPWTRKVTNESQLKKEIEAFFKESEAAHKKGDFQAAVAQVDFPVYMVTDDAKGMVEAKAFTREEYTKMMKPMFEAMPKDMTVTHNADIALLSDSLAVVVDDFSMTMNKQKYSGKNASQLIKRDGKWKWKTMTEAGWGGMQPGTGGAGSSSNTDTVNH